jgi:hypothetical protein
MQEPRFSTASLQLTRCKLLRLSPQCNIYVLSLAQALIDLFWTSAFPQIKVLARRLVSNLGRLFPACCLGYVTKSPEGAEFVKLNAKPPEADRCFLTWESQSWSLYKRPEARNK